MAKKGKLTQNQRNLLRRYLTWCYKTTKEDLDRVERYYTQERVDHFLLNELTKTKEFKSLKTPIEYKRLIKSFEDYVENKVQKADRKKFLDDKKNDINSNFLYLTNRFNAIEKAIINFLGKKELDTIVELYENEMTRRILGAREH